MWKQAIDDAVSRVKANIGRYQGKFPHVGVNGGDYQLTDNRDWTEGFWSGMLWLSYEYTGDSAYKDAACGTVESFRSRLANNVNLDHHDIGFLYSLSSKAQWILEQDESARELTLQAADVLMKRWRPASRLIQAWGREGDPANGGRIIIDCLMNLPLLYWAYQQTGDAKYREAAETHAEKSRRFLVRGDDSSYHTFYFDPENGNAVRGGTHQGYEDGSTWTRGQAWGIYGFALAYRFTRNVKFLETSRRLARYFYENLPRDRVAYWDFNAPVNAETKRDSSASAIAAAGTLELMEHLESSHPDYGYFASEVQQSMRSLVENYATGSDPEPQGLLKRGSYSVRGGASPDDHVIWGDYFYLESLLRLQMGLKGYWYEK